MVRLLNKLIGFDIDRNKIRNQGKKVHRNNNQEGNIHKDKGCRSCIPLGNSDRDNIHGKKLGNV